MEKTVKTLLVIAVLFIRLFANDNYFAVLDSYDKKFTESGTDEVLRIFHSLQNIYIKSIINSDEKLKKETLKRLIKSAKILGLDYKNYQNELNFILKSDNVEKRYTKIDTNRKRVRKYATKHKYPILKSLYVDNYKMVLEFDKSITSKDIKTFVLKTEKYYKKVFDFRAKLLNKISYKYPKEFQSVKMAQYDGSTLRVVFVTEKAKKYSYKIDKNRVVINFKTDKKRAKKREKAKEEIFASFNPHSKIIVIDPGHGGKDVGAIGYSKRRYEKSAVLKIALKCAKELKKRGYRVYLTRSRDIFVKLRKRTGYANRKKADLFISIHANAAPKRSKYKTSKGIETFFLSRARSERSKRVAALENRSDIEEMNYFSKKTFLEVLNREKIIQANKMALDVQQGMLKSLRTRYRVVDGGVREAPFWVLVGAQMPSILIEAGYITNPVEEKRLFSPTYQSLLAKGIADGIDNYFLKNL